MNHMGHTRTHDRVSLIGDVSLAGIVGQKNPIAVPADFRKEFRVLGIVGEMLRVPLNAIARVLERVRDALPEVAVGEKREPMLRIRKRALR